MSISKKCLCKKHREILCIISPVQTAPEFPRLRDRLPPMVWFHDWYCHVVYFTFDLLFRGSVYRRPQFTVFCTGPHRKAAYYNFSQNCWETLKWLRTLTVKIILRTILLRLSIDLPPKQDWWIVSSSVQHSGWTLIEGRREREHYCDLVCVSMQGKSRNTGTNCVCLN